MSVLTEMPENGKVVIAHPSVHLFAGVFAQREGLDLFLHDLAPTSHVYVLDIDAMYPPGWTFKP